MSSSQSTKSRDRSHTRTPSDSPSPEPNEPKDTTYKPTYTGKKRGRKRKIQQKDTEDSGSDNDGASKEGVTFPASKLFEYLWPPNDPNAKWYFLQEHVGEFLDIRSMQRRYPDLERRTLDFEEKKYLLDIDAVNETQCNMGLVAVASDDVLELMAEEFPDKYKEYGEAQIEKQYQDAIKSTLADMKMLAGSQVTQDHSASSTVDLEEHKDDMLQETVLFNSFCNSLRKRNYAMYENQPIEYRKVPRPVQLPRQRYVHKSRYPVALIPGQYSDTVRKYTSSELFQLPLKTVTSFPPTSC